MNQMESILEILQKNHIFKNNQKGLASILYNRLIEDLEKQIQNQHIESTESYIELIFNSLLNIYSTIEGLIQKQNAYDIISQWIEQIEMTYSYPMNEELKEEFERPVILDVDIELLKLLHNRQGIQNKELCTKLNLKPKAVRSRLEALSYPSKETKDKLKNEKQKTEIRIAGQHIQANVTKKGNKYLTTDTVHPIFLSLNVMQVATLLKSLQTEYQKDHSIVVFQLALNIWFQLSEYAKDKMQTVLVQSHYLDENFIRELDYESNVDTMTYLTEEEMMKEESMSLDFAMAYLQKVDRLAEIVLEDRCVIVSRIRKIGNQFELICLEGDSILVSEDEIDNIFIL